MDRNFQKRLPKYCARIILFYVLLTVGFYLISNQELKYKTIESTPIIGTEPLGELVDHMVMKQEFTAHSQIMDGVSLLIGTYARTNTASLTIDIKDLSKNTILYSESFHTAQLEDNKSNQLLFSAPFSTLPGNAYEMQIRSPKTITGNGITIYKNSEIVGDSKFTVNDIEQSGSLCFTTIGRNKNIFGMHYFSIMSFIGLLIGMYCFFLIRKARNGKPSSILNFFLTCQKYQFLIKQLVSRDFKTKYKRSLLGFCWSFLNPLLTMMVQYIVFSTIFRSDIDNFPVYLLSAGILFTFFTESVGAGLGSIMSNSALITKVYVPKYIYPVTKVLSTVINLLISTIPLLLVVLLTGGTLTPAVLLLPFNYVCVTIFCIGMSFILSSSMVFFRDTQFLWGIISLLWMYATPIFYPETIMPEHFRIIFDLNPMYHYITFVRTVLMEGISPQPEVYLTCLLSALFIYMIGLFIFKKSQNKFVLHL